MIKIAFVCHGNICRSPMAEFVFKKIVSDLGKEQDFYIASYATSSEEIGNSIHYGTRKILDKLGIDYSKKRAMRLYKELFDDFDMFIGMDSYNIMNMKRLFSSDKKIYKLMEFAGKKSDVADPWYTGDFETTYQDIKEGLTGLLNYIKKNNL